MLKTLEENYNKGVECPSCHEKGEFRQVYVGNDDKGWQETGEWECDNCDYQDIDIWWLKHSNINNSPDGKVSSLHSDECTGCSLCEGDQ